MMVNSIEVIDVGKEFGSKKVLNKINFQIQKGEIFGLLGPSGAGKTIFLTTHNMEEAHKLCNHVALLYNGKIVEYGEPNEVCRQYNHQNKIHMLLKSGESVVFDNNGESADAIAKYFKENMVESIHSSEPTLETVFMELTGRKLEE